MIVKIILSLIFLTTFIFAKGEITTVYTSTKTATYGSYYKNGKQYKWGVGNDLYIDGFEYNGIDYNYSSVAPIVKFRTAGTPKHLCTIFAESDSNISLRKLSPTFPENNSTATPYDCDQEKIMSGRVINIGILDLFDNNPSSSTPYSNNIERVDFIWKGGIQAPINPSDLDKAGHVVTEKSGNNPIKIAAILSLDSNGDPASYGKLVTVHPNSIIDDNGDGNPDYYETSTYPAALPYDPNAIMYGLTSVKTFNMWLNSGSSSAQKPEYKGELEEPLGMAFVSLEDLNISANQTYYGFSYFSYDTTDGGNPNNLVDYTNTTYFPRNTKSFVTVSGKQDWLWNGGNADPYGGMASYFAAVSVPTGGKISGYVFKDDNGDGVKDSSEGNMPTPTTLKFCKDGTPLPIDTISTTGYYEFYATSTGNYKIIEDANNTNDCTTEKDLTNWYSTTPNTISLTMNGIDQSNQNFGNININSFNAWDIDKNITNQIIATKIVNQEFNLTIASVDLTKNSFAKNIYSEVKAYIKSNPPGYSTTPQDLNMTDLNDTNKTTLKFIVDQPIKKANVAISYKDASGVTHEVLSTDTFAIRPNKFLLSISPPFGDIVAGDDFNITIQAVDINEHLISTYNEDLNSYILSYESNNSSCTEFMPISQVNFINGIAKIENLNYNGVGDINFSVKENPAQLFASIDSPYHTVIEPADRNKTFKANKFKIVWDYNGVHPSNDIAFYSNDTTMGAQLKLSIAAVDNSGNVIKNFRFGCYSEDTNVTVKFNTPLTNGTLITTLNGIDKNVTLPENNFTRVFEASTFDINGESNQTININFKRVPNLPLNPTTLSINEIKSNSTTITGNTPVNASIDFYYARAHAPDYYTTDKNFNATIYYEVYCNSCNKSTYTLADADESKDSVYWYILEPNIYNLITPTPIISSVQSSNANITISSISIDNINIQTKSLPDRTKITFKPDDWFLYDPYNQTPPRTSFYVNFNSTAKNWIGKGNIGFTVDKNVSNQKVNRIEW